MTEAGAASAPEESRVKPGPVLDLDQILEKFPAIRSLRPVIRPFIGSFLRLDRFSADISAWQTGGASQTPFKALFDRHGLSVSVRHGNTSDLEADGPLIIVANHPFGVLDALALSRLTEQAGRDFKILASDFLNRIPPIQPYLIAIDSFARKQAPPRNATSLREVLGHLKNNGVLILFPAGRVSHFRFSKMRICDPHWTGQVAGLARVSGARILPVRVHGRNSLSFYIVGLFHPAIRTFMLLRQLYRTMDRTGRISVSIGNPVVYTNAARRMEPTEFTNALREAVYAL